ncbi:accessory gene regulator B family protein [Clostridium sp. YIM B02505]|uniref:Accessory gene regulator B family protein n=1 Tax=Clostridium yunnanense TaxID=2800325 RepID=A0ABS1EK60_9CLOT|nr:accessory gene regulator B family protein [Clostridium yunnanense]MBK1809749.1 accessory gene regulator B family protein [Clostridium yunnanense]
MEKLTKNIAAKIAVELNIGNDSKEVIAYGIFAIMQIGLSIMLVMVFGLVFHVVIEALVVCLVGSILRRYSGGAHASTPSGCIIITTIVCVGLAAVFSFVIEKFINLKYMLFLGMAVFLWAYYLVYKLAPVDSPSKPIKMEEKKTRMRNSAIIVLSMYLLIVIINILAYVYFKDKCYLVYSLCVYGGMSWQVFTLTKIGHITINKIDFLK